jgi:hypothetical protein
MLTAKNRKDRITRTTKYTVFTKALSGKPWRLTALFSEEVFDREGGEMGDPGLYVDLPAWGYHFFRSEPTQSRPMVWASGKAC